MTLFLDGKGLSRSPKTTVENRMHQSKQFGELLVTANGFTLMKTNMAVRWMAIALAQRRPKKNEGANIEIPKEIGF